MPRALLLSALPLLLVACGDKDPDDSGAESDDTGSLDCTTEAVVSVHVTIELGDDVTAIPEDLAVTYAVDGGSPQPCESWSSSMCDVTNSSWSLPWSAISQMPSWMRATMP